MRCSHKAATRHYGRMHMCDARVDVLDRTTVPRCVALRQFLPKGAEASARLAAAKGTFDQNKCKASQFGYREQLKRHPTPR